MHTPVYTTIMIGYTCTNIHHYFRIIRKRITHGVRIKCLTPPEPLNLDSSNFVNTWQQWGQYFKLFMLARGPSTKDAKILSAALLHVIGPAALKAYNMFTWASNDDKQKVEMILEILKGHCIPCANVTCETHVLNTCNQHDDETIDHYVADLKGRHGHANPRTLNKV